MTSESLIQDQNTIKQHEVFQDHLMKYLHQNNMFFRRNLVSEILVALICEAKYQSESTLLAFTKFLD